MIAPTAFSHPGGRQVERMSTGVQMWGVTPPISLSGPTEKDLEITQALEEELRANNVFESSEEAKLREVVLGRVDALVKEFVYRASIRHGLSENAARASGGKIFTFGSYRLGVHGPGSDIDTLCVAPKHVQREDFFEIFEALLKERDDVTEVAAVPEAYVPLIKTKFMGISIDFLFARIPLPRIDDALELRDDNLLKNLDERDVRSLGGSRVTDEILRLVPNVHVFRLALRCIKLWAGRRAIYANVLGFLGGVAWAMLVARICQLYPNEVAGAIVSRFFLILLQWKWPQPVLLKPIEDGPLPIRVWNPRLYPTDRLHRMPIITPAYPSMCATHNVTQSTQMVMTQEFQRGSEIVDRIFLGKATWKELFEKHDFFHRYKYYLQVIASSGSADLQLKWEGTVESKLRQLIMKLELVPSLLIAHPFVDGFNHECVCYTDEEVRQVATGEMPPDVAARSKLQDLPPEGEAAKVKDQEAQDKGSGRRTVYTTTFYIGLKVEPRQAHETSVRRFDISYPTLDFTQRVKQWDQYDESAMGIVVRHIKGSHLPDYVFEGDPRPRKGPASKRAKNKHPDSATEDSAKKIKVSEAVPSTTPESGSTS
ncbi:polynucleotide adenylyltransferase [Malassezia arunalokei]|uniref:Poly(A) polymerase n=1 Tax=Malassezia arunalokei TaxID=1514897 RepID=A0AAJ6CMJ0_9BASI|nr:polynucleotide adenylyltransferase [Malassezia arunalokei]